MENNKILIGVQFTFNKDGRRRNFNLELYVLRDLLFIQLVEGISYGLKKLIDNKDKDAEVYSECQEIFKKCINNTGKDETGAEYFTNVTLTSYDINSVSDIKERKMVNPQFRFYITDLSKPISQLGFITSSKVVFDITGNADVLGKIKTDYLIEAFMPNMVNSISFPQYNISSRLIFKFDESDINILEPQDPPQKKNNSLFLMLLPSFLTVGGLVLVRSILYSGSNMAMIALTISMGIAAFVTTTITWKQQKKDYKISLSNWRHQYENYVDSIIDNIKKRQEYDRQKLDELYPDIVTLIKENKSGVYSLNDRLYSRGKKDEDFLTFRIGTSNDVNNLFKIKGNSKETIYSEAFFEIEEISGNEKVRLYLRNELNSKKLKRVNNLYQLPSYIAEKYGKMIDAPLLYSLKNKRCLGVTDKYIFEKECESSFFVDRMIFELCYYHSPENLQFVVLFKEKKLWNDIEIMITKYKYLPHFRGLFDDRSQFATDKESANSIFSGLLSIMGNRKENVRENISIDQKRIIVIVYEDYGIKEHALAEFLPDNNSSLEENSLDLSFVWLAKYKEQLPSYCDDIIMFEKENSTITPRNDINLRKIFTFNSIYHADWRPKYEEFVRNIFWAFQFLSSIYCAKIAQNGKVPSSLSTFELFNIKENELEKDIKRNWGIDGEKVRYNITKSLSVPVGKTETKIACIDLHERGDGPHMLVAGTTGSGKTETIITYLLGLCIRYRPDELNLLLVDMKGGGFTKRIGNLPHVVGKVTDVDGDENGTGSEYMLRRFLDAMKAEIKRRKILFNKMHVDSIDAYIEAFNNIEAHIARKKFSPNDEKDVRALIDKKEKLAHLVLVVDEFTELKRFTSENSEIDFISQITTIARVGRSLGFHIILISQNIEGAINDDIRVNTNARLCLKVATKQASKDMIGTDLAASPYMPGNGRAYFLVGTGSKFEYFQSAYSGVTSEETVPVEIMYARKIGAYSVFYDSESDNIKLKNKRESGTFKSQLEIITDKICRLYEANTKMFGEIHTIFRAPLPNKIYLDKDDNVVEVHEP